MAETTKTQIAAALIGLVLILIPEPVTTITGLAIVAGALGADKLIGD